MEVLAHVLDNRFFQLLAWPLIHFLWQACVIAVLVFASLKLINNRHSKLRYALSLLALVLCLISPLTTYLATESQMQASELIDVHNSTVFDTQASFISSSHDDTQLTQWLDYAPLLSLFWLIGVCFFSLSLLTQMYRTYQLPKLNTIAPSIELQQLFSKLIQRFSANKHSRLLISMSAEVPMVIGWIKPVVLLPLSMSSGLSLQQVEMLLAHEIAHIKRYDYLVNFLQTLVEVIFFFHPAVHWISKQVRAEREYCCDDVALSCCDNPLAYANTLTQAEMLRPHHIPTLAMAASGGDLKNRIFRVVDHQCTPKNTFNSDALVAVVVLSLLSSAFYNQKNHNQTLDVTALTSIETNNNPLAPTSTFEGHIEPLNAAIAPSAASINTTAPISMPAMVKSTPSTNTVSVTHQQVSLPQSEQNTSASDSRLAIKPTPALVKQPPVSAKVLTATQPLKIATTSSVQIEHGKSTPIKELPVVVPDKPITSTAHTQTKETAPSQKTAATIQHIESSQPKLPAAQVQAKTDQQPVLTAKKVPLTEVSKPLQAKTLTVPPSLPKPKLNSAPELIHSSPIDTPKVGFRRKERVSVQVTFIVDKQGKVDDFEFENGALAFRKAIKESVREWQFKPAITNGKQVTARVSREFIFTKPDFYDELPTTGTRIRRY